MMLYQQFISVLFSQLPFLVLYILVLVFALVRRRQFGTIATLLIVSMVTLILADLIDIFVGFMPALWRANLPAAPISTAYGVFAFIAGLLASAGWVFLVAAVFLNRNALPGGAAPLPPANSEQPQD